MMIYHNMFANGSSDDVSMLPWGIITFLVNELKKKKTLKIYQQKHDNKWLLCHII